MIWMGLMRGKVLEGLGREGSMNFRRVSKNGKVLEV